MRRLKGSPRAADAPDMDRDEPTPVGAIFDTNSKGRFDLVIYPDGLLAVEGTYVGVALRGAGAGLGGSEAGIGAASGSSYERNRLANKLRAGRREVLSDPSTFFVQRESIFDLALRKRWHGHSLMVRTYEDPEGRRFDWKPALNNFATVEQQLRSAFPDLVHRE